MRFEPNVVHELRVTVRQHGPGPGVEVEWPSFHKSETILALQYAKMWVLAQAPEPFRPLAIDTVELSVVVRPGVRPIITAPMWNKELAISMIGEAIAALEKPGVAHGPAVQGVYEV